MMADMTTLQYYPAALQYHVRSVSTLDALPEQQLDGYRPSIKTVQTQSYELVAPADGYGQHLAKIEELISTLVPIRDGFERPTVSAAAFARAIVSEFRKFGVPISKTAASADGGVAICVVKSGKYADIECLNSGSILAVTSSKGADPRVWEVEPSPSGLADAIGRIKMFLRS